MLSTSKSWKSLPVVALSLLLLPVVTQAQHYKQTNLVSDIVGMAPTIDPNLKNPWGLTRSSGSPWWIGNNNSGTSSLFNAAGNPINIFTEAGGAAGNFVVVPPPGFAPGTPSTPTGIVFNGSPTDFLLDKGTPAGKPAVFIFDTEDGTISGWNPGVNIPTGGKPPSINAVLEVDNSDKGGPDGAVYKGATSAEINGQRFLYVTNFRKARVEVYDTNFKLVHLGNNAFDPDGDDDRDHDDRGSERVPRGFAPFNIQNIGGTLFVTYAKQDAARHDPVGGDGFGFDLHSHVGRHQAAHLDHGAGRPDVAKDLAVGAADGFPVVLDVGDEEARAHDIREVGARPFQRRGHDAQDRHQHRELYGSAVDRQLQPDERQGGSACDDHRQ